MFYFDLKAAKIFQAVRWEKHPFFKYAKSLKRISFYFFIFVFLLFLAGLFGEFLSEEILSSILGLSTISLAFWIFFWLQESFFNLRLKKPRLPSLDLNLQVKLIEGLIPKPEQYNLAEFLSFEAAKTVSKSINFTKAKKLSQAASIHLFYFLLRDNPKLNFIFSRAILSLNEIKKTLKEQIKTEEPSLEKTTSD